MFRYRSFKNIGYNNSETPAVYSYETTEDTIAQVSVSGYFSDARAEIREGDLIVARCTDGSTTLTALNSDSVVAMPTAADITAGVGVSIEQFGAQPIDGFDNTPAIEAAALALGAGVLHVGYGKFEMSSTAYIPVGVYIVGASGNRGFDDTYDKSTCFAPTADAVLTEDYLFFMNIDPDGDTSTWVEAYPNNDSGGARHLTIDGSNLAGGVNGFKFAGSHIYKNINNKQVKTLIAKPSGVYTDKVEIKQIHSSDRANATDYLIDLPGLGDGYVLENIAASYNQATLEAKKGVNIGACRSGQLINLINGEHMLNGCKAVTVSNAHIEYGNITLKDCNATVRDSLMFCEEGVDGQIILESDNGSFGNKYAVTLDNNTFDQSFNRRGGLQQTARPDVVVNPYFTVNLKGNKRKIVDSTNVALQQYHGILVGTDSTTMLAEHNDYSHLFSNYECTIIANKVIQTGAIPAQNKSFGGLTAATVAISECTFNSATATYYYQAQLLQDKNRAMGRNSTTGETSLALTNGGANICKLTIGWNLIVNQGCVILRVYRGTATGAYTQYADIPIVSLKTLYDTGVNISGFVWQSRTSGGVDSLNSGLGEVLTLSDGIAKAGTTGGQPTLGTWKKGDRVEKVNLVAGTTGDLLNANYLRITDSANNVKNTDWITLQATQG